MVIELPFGAGARGAELVSSTSLLACVVKKDLPASNPRAPGDDGQFGKRL